LETITKDRFTAQLGKVQAGELNVLWREGKRKRWIPPRAPVFYTGLGRPLVEQGDRVVTVTSLLRGTKKEGSTSWNEAMSEGDAGEVFLNGSGDGVSGSAAYGGKEIWNREENGLEAWGRTSRSVGKNKKRVVGAKRLRDAGSGEGKGRGGCGRKRSLTMTGPSGYRGPGAKKTHESFREFNRGGGELCLTRE